MLRYFNGWLKAFLISFFIKMFHKGFFLTHREVSFLKIGQGFYPRVTIWKCVSEHTSVFIHPFQIACSFRDSIFPWLARWWAEAVSPHIDNHFTCRKLLSCSGAGVSAKICCFFALVRTAICGAAPGPNSREKSCLWHSPTLTLLVMLVAWRRGSANDWARPIRCCFHLCDYPHKPSLSPRCVCTPSLVLFVCSLVIPWATCMSIKAVLI